MGRKNIPFQWTKISRENSEKDKDFELGVLNGTSESELSLTTQEKRLIKVAVLHLQQNHMEDADNFFRIFIAIPGC